jgi:hypothetical protein
VEADEQQELPRFSLFFRRREFFLGNHICGAIPTAGGDTPILSTAGASACCGLPVPIVGGGG